MRPGGREPEGSEILTARSTPTPAILAPLRLAGWEAIGASVNGGPRCTPPMRRILRAHARKPRRVTMWLTVSGVETNRLSVRVLPPKRGCRKL